MQTNSFRGWRAAILKAVGSALLACGAALPHSASAQSVKLPGSPGSNPAMATCVPVPCKLCTPSPGTPGPGQPGAPTCKPSPIGNPNCGASPSVGAGNPINLITGNKYQEETDLPALPGVLGLELKRHYNSQSSHPGLLGARWRMSYEIILYDLGSQIQVVQADGRRLTFQRGVGANASLCTTANLQDGQVRIEAPRGGKGQATYHWRQADGQTLTFTGGSGGGHPLHAITAATGQRVTLAYSPTGDLLNVRDPQGRKLSFIYANAADKRSRALKAIDTPLGRVSYTQDSLGRLTEVASSKDATSAPYRTKLYHYEDKYNAGHKHALTGISVKGPDPQTNQQTEQRLSTYAYNQNGQAILSTKGWPKEVKDGKQVPETGIEQVEIQYVEKTLPFEGKADRHGEVVPKQLGKAILTNSLGHKTEVTSAVIGGLYRLIEMRGPGCSTCGPSNMRYAYNAAGQLVRETKLDDQGKSIASRLVQYDMYGRIARLGQQTHATARGEGKSTPEPVRWTRRFEYADVKYQDGSVAVAPQPNLITQPSVVAGKEHRIRVVYNDAGDPIRISEEGYSPLDQNGQPSTSGTPISRSTSYSYQRINGRSVLAQIDGPLPNGRKGDPSDSDVTRFRYDASADHLVGITYPMGLTASFSHDEAGRVARAVGIDGVVTSLRYGTDGAVRTVEVAGATSHVSHDVQGRLSELLDPLGQRLRMTYDAASRLALIGDAQNNRIALRRNTESELQQAQLLNPDGSVSQEREYQAMVPQRDPVLTGIRRLIDNAEDNIARPSFAKPSLTAVQELLAASDRLDSPRTPTTDLDVQGRATTYYRDDFGHLVAVQSPTTGLTRYAYNAAGQVTARHQADGSHAGYARDAAGRVVGIKATSAVGQLDEDAAVTWGKANKPSRIAYLAGEESFDYDSAARLIEHSQRTDERHFSLKYRYDSAGRLLTKTLPDGKTLSYRYRGSQHPRAGLLESVWLEGVIDRPLVEGMNSEAERYHQRGFTFGNGLANQTLRDARGRITQAGNSQVGRTRLRYTDTASSSTGDGEAGPPQVEQVQPVQMSRRAQAEAAQRFIERLRGETSGWLARPSTGPTRDASLGLGAGRGLGLTDFDSLGRQTTQGPAQFVYDSLSRLVEVKRTGSGEEEVSVARYRYNVFGQRVAKVVHGTHGKPGKVAYFFYDGSELAAEASADANGTATSAAPITTQYVHINGKPLAMLKPGRLGSTSVYFIHTDHRNAPLTLTDEARRVVWQAQVGDFGLTQVMPGASIEFNARASNQYFDAETGLHYNTHRYFDPVARRYLTPDPMGLAVGPDLYAFALNRPHEFTDPLGLAPIITDDDVVRASFAEKLKYVLEKAIPLVPSEIASELREMVQPSSIATVAAIFGVWAVAQLTPAGWIADVALLGIGYFFLGEAIVDLIKMVSQTYSLTDSAKCLSHLDNAASNFAKLASGAATSLGAAGAIKLARLLKRFFKGQKSGVWDLGPGPRGETIEKALGHNVPASYPKIDRWDPKTRTGTSIKSINFDDQTYLDPKKLKSRIKTMLKDLDEFNGSKVGGLDTVGKIAKKDMELVIPHSGSKGQQEVIKEMIEHAKSLGIELRVIVMP
jgi:RHS repeat-associated protein